MTTSDTQATIGANAPDETSARKHARSVEALHEARRDMVRILVTLAMLRATCNRSGVPCLDPGAEAVYDGALARVAAILRDAERAAQRAALDLDERATAVEAEVVQC